MVYLNTISGANIIEKTENISSFAEKSLVLCSQKSITVKNYRQ